MMKQPEAFDNKLLWYFTHRTGSSHSLLFLMNHRILQILELLQDVAVEN